MKFEEFMKSQEFKDFHDYFHCSRNNKYKFTKNKFETTLEYYENLYKKKEKNVKECKRIFNENDIKIIARERMRFYYVDEKLVEKEKNEEILKEELYEYIEEEYEDYREAIHVVKTVKTIEGNIPMMFKKNIKNNNVLDDMDSDNGIMYDYLTGEDNNQSSEEETEELF
tara:strand:+ start:443 stop:949 length:507 start_codon:yes stop_codon:yes gene_type:complete